ncbi:MAG: hypothetical protein IJS81_02765 [Selenomonadaceae bacterium]|nr:hypothetical protein [Selenomonadaceae bacterium]
MKIKGSGIYKDANGKNHRIIGVGELSDEGKLQELTASGNISFDKILCNEVRLSGKCQGGSINAQDLKISGGLSFDNISCEEADISGKCEGKSFSAENFSMSGKIEIDSLTIGKTLKLSGRPKIDSATADEIFIGASGGFIGEIKCRNLKIIKGTASFAGEIFGEKFFENFLFNESHSRIRVKKIEAEKITLENCAADVIKCKDIFIGSNCAIEKLFVAGDCKVSADSTVGETIHI